MYFFEVVGVLQSLFSRGLGLRGSFNGSLGKNRLVSVVLVSVLFEC